MVQCACCVGGAAKWVCLHCVVAVARRVKRLCLENAPQLRPADHPVVAALNGGVDFEALLLLARAGGRNWLQPTTTRNAQMAALGVGDGAIVVCRDPWVLEWRRGGGCMFCFDVVFAPPRPLLAASPDALDAPARPCLHVVMKTTLTVFNDFFERVPHGVRTLLPSRATHSQVLSLSLHAAASRIHALNLYSKHADFAVDSATRFRNLLLAPSAKLSLEELRRFNGYHEGREADKLYFGCRGWIYDASSSDSFRGPYIFWAGRDATFSLATMSMKPEDASRTDRWLDAQLSPKEVEVLEGWERYFSEKYLRVARVAEYDEQHAAHDR